MRFACPSSDRPGSSRVGQWGEETGEVRETHLPNEDDSKSQPAFLVCSIQKECSSQTTSTSMVDTGILILHVTALPTTGSSRCLESEAAVVPGNFPVREALRLYHFPEQIISEVPRQHTMRLWFRVGFCCQWSTGVLGGRNHDESLLWRLFQQGMGLA